MIALVKAPLSNCSLDRGSPTATYVKPFDLFALESCRARRACAARVAASSGQDT